MAFQASRFWRRLVAFGVGFVSETQAPQEFEVRGKKHKRLARTGQLGVWERRVARHGHDRRFHPYQMQFLQTPLACLSIRFLVSACGRRQSFYSSFLFWRGSLRLA
jgi:hypothetical protein